MVADQVSDYLDNGNILNSVNFPNISLPRNSEFRLAIACTSAADQGAILSAVESVGSISKTRGDLAFTLIDAKSAVSQATIDKLKAIAGVLQVRYMAA